MLKRLFVIGATVASAGAAVGFVQARAQFRRWGIDPAEATKALPGDDIVPDAEAIDTRGIDIAAPPAEVWPWLVQMGYGKAGWYSYDGIDMDHPSADRILPEHQALEVGDVVPTHPGGGFIVKVLNPGEALVLYADRELVEGEEAAAKGGLETASANVRATGKYLDAAMRGDFRASWAFVLEPRPDGGSRLIERFRGRMEVPTEAGAASRIAPAVAGKALLYGLFMMVHRQMLGIRDRAERRPVTSEPGRTVKAGARAKALRKAAEREPIPAATVA